MNRRLFTRLGLFFAMLATLAGCVPTQPFYFGERADLSQYLDGATDVSYPDVHEPALEEVTHSRPPLTLSDPEFDDYWDLTLEDVVSIALQNSKVLRGGSAPALQGSAVVAPGNDQLANSGPGSRFQATIYNPAIRESEVGFIGTLGQVSAPGVLSSQATLENGPGVEAALAEFDAQWTSSFFWEKSDRPQNNTFGGFFARFQELDTSTFQNEISKKTAEGTQVFVRERVEYQNSNSPILALPSTYTASLEVEARQPLLRGRGAQINRMPIVVARIGTDQEIAGFESQLQNYLTNIEIRYWDLYCAYRSLEAAKKGRDASLHAWRRVYTLYKGGQQIRSQDEAQSREQYFAFRAALEQALSDLYNAETNLRWLMGLSTSDGRLIRPIDEPTKAKLNFDWNEIKTEALVRRPLLRQQRWEIKKKELQVIYARNGLLPQLNMVALYRWLGLGDDLINADRNGLNFPTAGSTAYDNLTEGDFQELRLGVELAMPIGYRRELANIRNAQLKLAREKAFLEDMELDVSRELTHAIQALDTNYYLAQTHLNRWTAANTEVEGRTEILEKIDSRELDLLLNAQRRQAQAQSDYYRALCEYNKVIALIQLRKGSILDFSGVQLGEGPWPDKAYWDAKGHARRRAAGYYLNYGWSRPGVISQGPMPQHVPMHESHEYIIEHDGETIDAPQPTPAKPQIQEDPHMPAALLRTPNLVPLRAAAAPASGVFPIAESPAEAEGKWDSLGLHVPQKGQPATTSVLRKATYQE